MSWHETHRRWQALREVESTAARTGRLPWREDYEEIFGDRSQLVAALRHRWRQTVQAQLDPQLPETVYDEVRERLSREHRGVLRVLADHGDRSAGEWLADAAGLAHAS
jgi:hypothetical protein